MFSNLRKKIESEVGDLSKLTPNLRSITHSEKMTPLSSRHNSVSSLASETSYTTTNKITSPQSPNDSHQSQPLFGSSSSRGIIGDNLPGTSNSGRSDNTQQKLKRVYEEKLQTQELDFAWRLNTKDDEISKLQKQVEHLNNLLHSKEFETQQKLVRVQEDMDSLEGFSQQENAKIKHLLLNREEELCQLRATVMMRDSLVAEFESQIKNISVENDRLKKSLDEVVGRQGNLVSLHNHKIDEEVLKQKLSTLEDQATSFETQKQNLERSLKSKDIFIEKLQTDMRTIQHEAESSADALRKENSFVLKELKELTGKCNKLSHENELLNETKSKTQEELKNAQSTIELKEIALNEALEAARKLQEVTGELTLQIASHSQDPNENEFRNLQSDFEAVKTNFNRLECELMSKEDAIKKLEKQCQSYQEKIISNSGDFEINKQNLEKLIEEKSIHCKKLDIDLIQQRNLLTDLQQKLDELTNVEVENNELVLQISEIQSKYDELEEENKFLKESAQPDDYEALKRKVTELDGELLDRNQMLKQQSHQLQDLRRSLAKEINKNQAISEVPVTLDGISASQCNGSLNQPTPQASASSLFSEPPTLPPQETDMNFMYLRSVLFKFLTTTDVQVTHQLTRVVATLLHLSEEETHMLSQATESRHGWVSLIKS